MGARVRVARLLVRSAALLLLLMTMVLPQRTRGADTAEPAVFPAGTVPPPAPGPRVAFVLCRAPRLGEFTCEWRVRADGGDLGVAGVTGVDLVTPRSDLGVTGGDLVSIPAELQHSRLLYAFYGEEDEVEEGEEEEEDGVRECVSGEPQLARSPSGLVATFRCHFPDSDILYFTPLRITIPRGGPGGGPPLYHASRVYIDQLVVVDAPRELALSGTGRQGRLNASWAPAAASDFPLMFQLRYERNAPAGRATPDPPAAPHERIAYDTSVELLFPDEEAAAAAAYVFRVRARASDQGLYAGPWSEWSPAVTAAPPFVTGKLAVRCFTADLQLVVCEWHGARDANLSDTSFAASYQVGGGPARPCAAEWQREWEERDEEGAERGPHPRGPAGRCGFVVDAAVAAAVLVTVNASNARGRHEEQFGPFRVRHHVRPGPPVNVSAEPDVTAAGDVTVAWAPPSRRLSDHLHYELRYIADNSSVWKLVSVGRSEGGRHRLHSLRPGPGYRVQVRARPDGVSLAGEWGAWSAAVSVKPRASSDGAAWLVRAMVAVALLLLLLAALGASLAHAGRIKQRVWPPIPSLEAHFANLLQRWLGEPYEAGCGIAAECDAQICVVEVLSELADTSKADAEAATLGAFEGKLFDELGKEVELPLLIESAGSLAPKAVPARGSPPPPPRNNNNNNRDSSAVRHVADDLPDRRATPGGGGGGGGDEEPRGGPPRRDYVRHGHAPSLWPGPPFANGNFSNLAYVPPLGSAYFGTGCGGVGGVAVVPAGRPLAASRDGDRSRRTGAVAAPRPATAPGRHSYVNCGAAGPAKGRGDCAAARGPRQRLLPYVNQSLESSV